MPLRANHGGEGPKTTRGSPPVVRHACGPGRRDGHRSRARTARACGEAAPRPLHSASTRPRVPVPLSHRPLSSAVLCPSREARRGDRATVRHTLDLLVLARGVGRLRFLLDTLYASRQPTASTMHPSGPSQNTAYEWGRDWGEACGGPGRVTPGPAPSRRRSEPPPASAYERRGAGGQADAATSLQLRARDKQTGGVFSEWR